MAMLKTSDPLGIIKVQTEIKVWLHHPWTGLLRDGVRILNKFGSIGQSIKPRNMNKKEE